MVEQNSKDTLDKPDDYHDRTLCPQKHSLNHTSVSVRVSSFIEY